MIEVCQIDATTARSLSVEHHYLHKPPPVSFAFGLSGDSSLEWLGVVTFGTPASRHLQVGACPSDPNLVLELNRLWVCDSMPKNTESWFVTRALRALPPRIVVSYADTAWGHAGYVYRAMSWNYAGWTDMDRKTPRYDYVPHKAGAHTREAYRSGYKEKVRRLPKIKYWTTTGARSDRRRLAEMCGWPKLDWKELPPPG